MSITIGDSVKVYPGVKIGKNSSIGDSVILGLPSQYGDVGESLTLEIGEGAKIRPFSVIYAGNRIGKNFETGHGVTVKNNNVIGDNVRIGTNTYIRFGNQIGNRTRIHAHCFLELTEIGDCVFVGPGTISLTIRIR